MEFTRDMVLKRAGELEQEAKKVAPFSQAYNNLNERHTKLLNSYNHLVVEFREQLKDK